MKTTKKGNKIFLVGESKLKAGIEMVDRKFNGAAIFMGTDLIYKETPSMTCEIFTISSIRC